MFGVAVSSESRTFLTFTVFELSDVTLKPIQSGTDFDLASTTIRMSLYLKSSMEPNYADFDMVEPFNLQGDTTFTYLAPGSWFILISSSEATSSNVRIGFETSGTLAIKKFTFKFYIPFLNYTIDNLHNIF